MQFEFSGQNTLLRVIDRSRHRIDEHCIFHRTVIIFVYFDFHWRRQVTPVRPYQVSGVSLKENVRYLDFSASSK
jgi:hypothetical protein